MRWVVHTKFSSRNILFSFFRMPHFALGTAHGNVKTVFRLKGNPPLGGGLLFTVFPIKKAQWWVLRTAGNGGAPGWGRCQRHGISKHFSPLATVRLLGLFSTICEGCISLVAEVEPRPLHPAAFMPWETRDSRMMKVSVVEVGARPAGAATGGVGCRLITGGRTMTISPDLVCMRIGNTERHHGTICTCVPSRPLERGLCTGKGVSGGG